MGADNWGEVELDWGSPTTHDTAAETYARIADKDRETTGAGTIFTNTLFPGITEFDGTILKGFPEFSFTCSTGDNKCPDTHPYSFNYGQSCCVSPFSLEEVSSKSLLLTPETVTLNNCVGNGTDTDGTEDGFIPCPHMTAGRACRTNLDNLEQRLFKATEDKVYNYVFRHCLNEAETCGNVEIVSATKV